MVIAGGIALGFYVLASIFQVTLRYIMKEHPGDYKARLFFSVGALILGATFWGILFLMGLITIIKLIWGG